MFIGVIDYHLLLCSGCFGSQGRVSILQYVENQLNLFTKKTKLQMAGQVAFTSSFKLLDSGQLLKQQFFRPKSSPMLMHRSCFLI